jgi:hypothetical protein
MFNKRKSRIFINMSYQSRRFTFGSKTTAQITAITLVTNPELAAGMSAWNSDLKKPEYWTGTVWTNEDCVLLVNTSGSTIATGRLVRIDTTQTSVTGAILTDTAAQNEDFMIGVVHRGAANTETMVVAIQGLYPVKYFASETTSTRGNLIQLSSTAGEADQITTIGSTDVIGVCAESRSASQMIASGNLVKCFIQTMSSL